MKSSLLLPSLTLLTLQPNVAHAFWRMVCGVSQTSRTDPILAPGTVSGHVHKFAGGNNVNPSSNQNSLLASACSSCQVQEDKSAYWTPQLYYAHSNGTVEEVQNEGMTVYYVGRGGDASNTVAFPPGFQMISGNSLVRAYDTSNLTYENTRPIADRVSFRCINEANNIPEQHYMFDTNCVNGMRAQINFQSCWDGQNLYLPGSQHVAYLSGIDYGTCPPTHPIPIPGLFYEVLYWTNRVDQSAGGQFVFANGDATGYGFHGDFLNGWNQDVQTAAVKDCLYTDNGGVISACSALAPSEDDNVSRTCPESPSVWDEPVHGFLSSIPGCNPVTTGPGVAPQVICPLNSNTPPQSVQASIASVTSATPSTTISISGLNSTPTSTTSIDGSFTQPSGGVFATVSINSTATSTMTMNSTSYASSLTPLLSFTTIYVTATATATQAAFTGFTSVLSGTDACSLFSGFSIPGCPSSTPITGADLTTALTATQVVTGTLTSTFTTTITFPTSTATSGLGLRRRKQKEASDLAKIIEEVVGTEVEGTPNKGTGPKHNEDAPTISSIAPQPTQQGDATYHGSGMGCMLWGSCGR